MPGYKVPFYIAQNNSKYTCSSCGLLLRDAMQMHCSHHYCKTCLTGIFAHKLFFNISVKCLHEDCNMPLEQQSSFADRQVQREILTITTSCLYAGCDWKDELGKAEEHYRECDCKPVACTNAGCDISVPPNELAHHQEEVCPSRMVVCNSCNLSVKVTDHENHIGTCDYTHVTCHNCGKENIQLRELKKHKDPKDGDCTKKECPFREYGCVYAEKMSHDQLYSHLEEYLVSHQLIFPNQMEAGNNQHRDVANQLDVLKESLNTAQTKIDWALQNQYQMIMNLAEDVKVLKGKE